MSEKVAQEAKPQASSSDKKKSEEGKVDKKKGEQEQPLKPMARKKQRRAPRTAAIMLTCPRDRYADTMAEVRTKV